MKLLMFKISLKLRSSERILNKLLLIFLFSFSLLSCGSSSPLFKSSSKKGPNIYSSKPPLTKSRSKLYIHSISKKKVKGKRTLFSSKKKRYKSTVAGPKGSKDKGAKESSGGRKSGKGRKKQ